MFLLFYSMTIHELVRHLQLKKFFFSHNFLILKISFVIIPPICTTIIADVFFVIFFSILLISIHISSPQSAKIGLQPEFKIALTEAIKVFDGTIISFPEIFKDLQINSNADVPLLHETAYLVPIYLANFSSNSLP